MIEEGRNRKHVIGKKNKEERAKRGQKRELREKYDKKNVKRREKEKGIVV
jgi:hypothetical protein